MLLGLVPKSFFSIPKALGWGRLRHEPKERNRRGEGPGDEVAAKIHFQPIFPTLVVHRQNFWARRNRKQNIHNRGLSVNEPKLNGVRLGKHGQKVPQTLETGKRRAGENTITRNPRVSITRRSSIPGTALEATLTGRSERQTGEV